MQPVVEFWSELRRREVIRVAIAYLVVAWLIVQVAVALEAAMGLPAWFDGLIVALLILGFPVVMLGAWAFEMTPEGLRRTQPGGAAKSVETADVSSPTGQPDAAGEAHKPRSIAVLPFADMSPERDQDYFAEGLSEELMNRLAHLRDLRVIGRTSSFAFKGRSVDLRTIGDTLGAQHLLEGSVRKADERLRVTAQLIDASDGSHVWSETYDRRLDDVFAIQEDIASSVAEALSVTLGVGEATAAASVTEDVETYDIFLRARGLANRGAPADLARAAELYREVLTHDPNYAPARVALTVTLMWMWNYLPERTAEVMRECDELAGDARARAPDHWSTRFLSGLRHLRRHEFADAEREIARTEALAPATSVDVPAVHALFLLWVGRPAAAIATIEASLKNDPLSTFRSLLLQRALDFAGRAEEAEAEYVRSRDLPGQVQEADLTALFRIWNQDDAELILDRFDRYLRNQTLGMPLFAAVRDVCEDADAALALLRTGHDDPANQDPSRQTLIGVFAAHYGDAELALAAVRRAFMDMKGSAIFWLWCADLAAARRLPGFKDLVRDIGLVAYWRETGNWGDFARPVGEDDFECF